MANHSASQGRKADFMNAIISVCNLKGGAGKSTIAVNIACALKEYSYLLCKCPLMEDALHPGDRMG